ncbi:MAG TPA: FAD-binding oxidoreductase [Ramlibacter sp.]|nr:FAD-binding oxidoreductase [Ramlibacter sp.]
MRGVSSWGRLGALPHRVVPLLDPARLAAQVAEGPLPGLAYGMGRSYGDVCLNPEGTLWETRALDHFVSFDDATGELVCEPGVLLGDIQRSFAGKGWMLPVSPGTQFVTVGGAIANDVHGKNHHVRGSFGDHVSRITLVRTDGRVIECGPEVEREWFRATVGGLGLTGVISQTTIRLQRVPGPWLETETIPFDNLNEFFVWADSSEADWEYTVAWIDCLAPQGRGLFMRARPTEAAGRQEPSPKRLAVPFEPPLSLVNKVSLRAFNAAYYQLKKGKREKSVEHYSTFLYPLDDVAGWNRMYGPRGFYQYQSVVPHAHRKETTAAMLEAISTSGEGSFLAVLKTFGNRESPGMLSFPMHGTTLALDFANAGERTTHLFGRLDAIVSEAGGRIYPAKDARMPRELFERGYPKLTAFHEFRDPGISSGMSRRLMGN